MSSIPPFISRKLKERIDANSFRKTKVLSGFIDFHSNDYLGFAKNKEIENLTVSILNSFGILHSGSTGSRLISGSNELTEEAERFVADYFSCESALIFNSGYDANLGLFSSIASRNDTIIYDEYVHASIRDGIRLSYAKSFSFRHNDLNDLEAKIRLAGGSIFVVTESVFSMDGDLVPMENMIALVKESNAYMIVDEAHASGYLGIEGKGLTYSKISEDVFARIITFGKAFGYHGAAVLGSKQLISFLKNYSRPFIYSTALPLYTYARIIASLKHHQISKDLLSQLINRIEYYNNKQHAIPYQKLNSQSAIQSIIIPGNNNVKFVADKLKFNNLGVVPIMHPTVPLGKERIRITLHSYNTSNEIDFLISILSNE